MRCPKPVRNCLKPNEIYRGFSSTAPHHTFMNALNTGLLLALMLPVGTAFGFDHTHSDFTAILKRHVRGGRVDYRQLKAGPARLMGYLENLAKITAREFDAWSRDQQLAYLINLYNARTLGLILDNFPITSIKKIGWLPGAAWRKEFIPLFGKTVSLGRIEHDLLRKHYRVPEIHFALVCAAKGCPPLRSEAYTAEDLSAQLITQGREFLADPLKNRVDVPAQRLHLSPIFKWFAEDFEAGGVSVPEYIRAFLPPATAAKVTAGFEVRHTEYDWSLNDSGK